jgi:glycosyltransferase involved in cell wall biosynthesis
MSPLPPLVSVVVPVRNGERTIEECVRSLVAQSYPRERLEIVVVDNGSLDGTRAILAAFEPGIVVIAEAMPGASAARNAGVRRARGEIVVFTDADCTTDERWLTELVWPLNDRSVGICGGAILARGPANAAELFGEAIHDHAAAMLSFTPPYAVTMNWASPREVLVEVGMFDVRLRRCQDAELAYRIVRAGYRLAYCPAAVVYHRNERNAAGLFREGLQHGFHGTRVRRLHTAFIGQAKLEQPEGRATADAWLAQPARYRFAFRSGMRIGRAGGAIWSSLRSY